MNKFLSFIKKSWQEGTQIGKSNIITAAVLGGGAHVILYFIYKYHFGLYENIYLRLTTSFLCVSVSCYYYLPKNIKTKYFPFYWHIMLIMALPFVITVNLFKTNFHEAWLYWDIFVMFLLALYVPNWFIYAIDLVIGFGGAFIFYSLTTPGCSLDPQFDILAYSIVFLFSGIAGMGFVYGNRYAWLERQKKQYTDLIEFAGSIAHEMRNPIDAINLSLKTLPEIKVCNSANQIDLDDLKSINEHKDLITKTIKLARGIIDMTLLQLSNKKISKQDFTYLKASEIIKDSVEIYGYKAHEERNKISINIKKDFIFRAIETSFKYTLFNLIKNSLYYSTKCVNSNIIIGVDKKIKNNQEYNVIYVYDNGPGISSEDIPKLFDSFVTIGKKEGTGLGLAFCKRTMLDFEGDIDCESALGKWTRFNLYFPILNDEELEKAQHYLNNKKKEQSKEKEEECLQFNSHDVSDFSNDLLLRNANVIKRVLIADDQDINLQISQNFIKRLLPNTIIDLAVDGKEALELVKKNQDLDPLSSNKKYDIIITDIQMPKIDGFMFTKKVRAFDKSTPIAAYTSRTSYKIKKEALDIGIDDYIIKPIPNDVLVRVVYKWLINDHQYEYNIQIVKNYLKNKGLKVLIADDEEINFMLMKRFLNKYNFEVDIASNGQELIDKYIAQFSQDDLSKIDNATNLSNIDVVLYNKYDIIVADINMPIKTGDDAAKEIRNFELLYNIQNKAIIIANSGDSELEKLKSMLKNGMDDYFIKGEDNNKLLKIIYFWKNILDQYIHSNEKEIAIPKYKEYKILNQKLNQNELKELKSLFVKTLDELMIKIRKATQNKDVKDLAFQTHALKGVAGNFGAEKLFNNIVIINNFVRLDKWPDKKNWLQNLENIAKETLDEVSKI